MMRSYVCAAIVAASIWVSPIDAASLITNGSFENVAGPTLSYAIDASDLPGWTASPSPNKFLDCLISPLDTGTKLCGGTTTNNPSGWSLSFYVTPGASPDGGNFVGIDGDAGFAVPLSQTINGLTIGTTYQLFFYQAAGQQSGFSGTTTERWGVCLLPTATVCDSTNYKLSTLMNTPDHGGVGWMAQTMRFVASSTSEKLTFIAVGTPSGQPPFVFLDGTSLTVATPEPGTYILLGLSLAGLLVVRRRRSGRVKRSS